MRAIQFNGKDDMFFVEISKNWQRRARKLQNRRWKVIKERELEELDSEGKVEKNVFSRNFRY